MFVPSRRGRRVLDDYVAAIDVIEASYAEILGSTVFDELARSARDLSRMLTLEHTFSGAVSAVPDAPNPRRQGELAELAGELHRWLGASDTWWLSGILRQQVIDDIDAARTERAEAFEGGSR